MTHHSNRHLPVAVGVILSERQVAQLCEAPWIDATRVGGIAVERPRREDERRHDFAVRADGHASAGYIPALDAFPAAPRDAGDDGVRRGTRLPQQAARLVVHDTLQVGHADEVVEDGPRLGIGGTRQTL